MTTRNYLSPHGVPIVGTLEHIPARAEITGISDKGEPFFTGDTEEFWDDQSTVLRDGKVVFLCEEGGEWTFDQLTPCSEPEIEPLSEYEKRHRAMWHGGVIHER